MDLTKDLSQLGLTQNQAKVYLACLQLGVDTVWHIAKFANLKRPTVYLILDDLGQKGLVSKTKKDLKTFLKLKILIRF